MTEGELLQRIAETLRKEIGPAVDAEYPKTQAFMAGVVLHKLGQQLTLADPHRRAAAADLDSLVPALRQLLSTTAPHAVIRALDTLATARNPAAVCALIEALYAARAVLGEASFGTVLARIRVTLRGEIDRRMEYAA